MTVPVHPSSPQILLPVLVSRYTAGPRPMDVYLKAFVPRLLFGLLYAWFVWVTPAFALEDGSFPHYYYGIIVVIFIAHQVTLNCMFVAMMAFFARISDPAVGGTYMTLLNTLSNLGGNWPATLALWVVDSITVKRCAGIGEDGRGIPSNVSAANVCDGAAEQAECEGGGGRCEVLTDGYYLESVACVIVGFLWLGCWGWRTVRRLQVGQCSRIKESSTLQALSFCFLPQSADSSEWRVVHKATNRKKERVA